MTIQNPAHPLRAPDRQGRHQAPLDAWTPGEAAQFDALVAACALVAVADGWVTTEERRRTRERLRGLEAMSLFGIEDGLAAFDALIDRVERDEVAGIAEAEAAVSRLRNLPAVAPLLVAAACSVAAADGGHDAEERQVILRLCQLLDLDPARFDLMALKASPVLTPNA